jgi:pimeloyl-ACP methyl ester carboxylesterase
MFLEINGQRLNVVAFAAGDRTIVTHGGWTGSWELWQQPMELLSRSWRCVGYDHRGCGESPVAPEDITPQALVEDLFGVLDALEIERCVLAAESLGCVVAIAAAHAEPERFEGLVLVAGTPAITSSAEALIKGSRSDYPATVAAFVHDCAPEPELGHLRRWGEHMLHRADGASAARLLECYLKPVLTPTPLAEITVPTLVIHGTADRIVPVEVGRAVAAAIPGAELVLLEGAGHVPTVTHPYEVARVITQRFGR